MYNIDEKDKEFAKTFSEFVNGEMCSAKKTGMELANDHRYLVNEKFKVVLASLSKRTSQFYGFLISSLILDYEGQSEKEFVALS